MTAGPDPRDPCHACGGRIGDGEARWCGHCGAALSASEPVPCGPSSQPAGTRGATAARRRASAGLVDEPMVRPTSSDTGTDPRSTLEPADAVPRPARQERRRGRAGERRRWLAGAGAVALTAAVLTGGGGADDDLAGAASRGDGTRTGVVASEAPGRPVPAWTTPAEVGVVMPADVHGDTDGEAIVLTRAGGLGDDSRMSLHDATDGALRWMVSTDPTTHGPALLLPDGVLVGSASGSALHDRTTGRVLWTSSEGIGQLRVTATASDRLVVIDDRTLRAIDTTDGSSAWSRPVPAATAALEAGSTGGRDVVLRLVPLGDTTRVVAHDAATGTERWRADVMAGPVDPVVDAPRLLVRDRTALVVGTRMLVELDLDTGRQVRRLDTPSSATVDAVSADGGVVVVTATGDVRGRTGDGRSWAASLPAGSDPSSARAARVVATSAGVVVHDPVGVLLLDPADGRERGASSLQDDERLIGIGPDGTVVVVTDDGTLRSSLPGGRGWRVATPAPALPDLVTAGDRAVVTTIDGAAALDVGTGTVVWSTGRYDPAEVEDAGLRGAAIMGDLVVLSPPDGIDEGPVGLELGSGLTRWQRPDDLPPRASPVPDRDLLLISVGQQVHGFAPGNGRRALVVDTGLPRGQLAAAGGWLAGAEERRGGSGDVWVARRADRRTSFRAPEPACADPMLLGSRVLFPTAGGAVIARDLATGEQPWGRVLGGDGCAPLSLVDDTVVAVVDGTRLLGLDAADGQIVWRAAVPAGVAAPPTVAGGLLLVPTLDGGLLGWRVGEDEPRWRAGLDGVAAGSAAVTDGTVLIQLRDGRVVGLRG